MCERFRRSYVMKKRRQSKLANAVAFVSVEYNNCGKGCNNRSRSCNGGWRLVEHEWRGYSARVWWRRHSWKEPRDTEILFE